MTNQPSSLSRHILVVLCIAVVFTALVLVALNAWVKNKQLGLGNGSPTVDQISGGQTYDEGYKMGYNVAREKFRNVPLMPANTPILALNGTIQEITKNQLQIKATNLDTDEAVDGVSDVRLVDLDANTKITQRTPISPDKLSKLINDWQKNGIKKNIPPPNTFEEKTLTLKDLKTGMLVTALAGQDIRLAGEFKATQIVISSGQ